jgi:hypothetical protein
MKPITTLARRFAAFLNPTPVPGDVGSMPRLRDYPFAKPPASRR